MLFLQPVEHPEIKRSPLFSNLAPCGFPSPTQDYIEEHADLNDLLVQHSSATYFVKSSGDSTMEAGIDTDDLLVVNSARKAAHRDIVITAIEGGFIVKYLQSYPVVMLEPENSTCAPIMIDSEDTLDILGIVTFIIKSTGQLCLHWRILVRFMSIVNRHSNRT